MPFTISQTPLSTNLFLYPNGAGDSTQLSKVGDTANYLCVDDSAGGYDEDATYVFSDSQSFVCDLYNVENSSVSSGTINYVAVFARSKSHLNTATSTSKYWINLKSGSTVGSSDVYTGLDTAYVTRGYMWQSKPGGGSWSWSDVNSMQIGITHNSKPVAYSTYDAYYRPNGNFTVQFSPYGDTANYLCVDDEIPDDDTTYAYYTHYGPSSYYRDRYNIPSTTYSGTINFLRVYCRAKWTCEPTGYPQYINTTLFDTTYGDYFTSHILSKNVYSTYASNTYYTKPWSGASWSWSDLSTLKIGARFLLTEIATAKLTQCYLQVNYSVLNVSPEIRTTQVYAVVNYTPSPVSVSLPLPRSVKIEQSADIHHHRFGDGDYTITARGIRNKSLSISGCIIDNASETVKSIRDMIAYKSVVTVSGLPNKLLNGEYIIRSFSPEESSGSSSRIYDYTLVLDSAS